MMLTIDEIAAKIVGEVLGDGSVTVSSLAEPAQATPEDLALATNAKYAADLTKGRARAALLWSGADYKALGLDAAILPERPRHTMAGLTALMDPGQGIAAGIHPSAIIDESAHIGPNVAIGAGVVIGPQARIGEGSVIGPLCTIGWQASIGPNAQLREHVSIGAKVEIGARFIAQPGVRIGGDGFSFVTPEKSGVENVRETLGEVGVEAGQRWERIHSLGSVVIGDDVEIGTNTAIDSGTIRPTRIGHRTKIDNLVHIGHNCEVGEDNLICGMVGLAGSVVVGNFVVMAGQCGVSDNLTIGDRVVLAAATKVMRSVPDGKVMLGYPATEMTTQIDSYKALRRLPRFAKDLAAIKKVIFKEEQSR